MLPEFVAVAVKCAASASFNPLRGSRCSQSTASAPAWIRERFNPLRGSRCSQSLPHDTPSRQAPLPRSYTPPPLTPSEQRTESVLNGVNPLVKWHTHLRLFLVVLQHPCPRVSPRCPVAGSWASSWDSTSGGVGVWGGRSGVGFAGRLPEWFRHSRSLALTSWLNQLQKLSPRADSTSFEEPSSRIGPICFRRNGFDTGRSFVAARLNQLQKASVAARLNQLHKYSQDFSFLLL